MILTHDSEPWSHVVGIDPGETTGLCAIRLGSGVRLKERVLNGSVFMGQIAVGQDRSLGAGAPWHMAEPRTQRSIAGRLVSLAEQWGVEDCLHLAIEDFVIRERTQDRSLLSPVRMTSGMLALLEEYDRVNVVVHLNSAGDAKSVIRDDTLRSHGLYRAGMGHAMDAARHALLVLRKEL